MGRSKSVCALDRGTLRRAERDLQRIPRGRVTLRLIAVIAVGKDQPFAVVSEILGVSRQSVARWVQGYKREGLTGLVDRPKGHRRRRVSRVQETQIRGWLVRGVDPEGHPIHWTIDQLQGAIRKHFGVRLGRTRVWLLMREWGFRLKVPRPRHVHASPRQQRAFKKTPSPGG